MFHNLIDNARNTVQTKRASIGIEEVARIPKIGGAGIVISVADEGDGYRQSIFRGSRRFIGLTKDVRVRWAARPRFSDRKAHREPAPVAIYLSTVRSARAPFFGFICRTRK